MTPVFHIVVYILAVYYGCQVLLFFAALSRRQDRAAEFYEPSVSIIVAARNEEDNLPECLSSLAQIDYPAEKLELVLVDHDSEDSTYAILDDFARNRKRCAILHTAALGPPLSGKAAAVSQGIEMSSGEIVLLTDADCAVPNTWVRSIVAAFSEGIDAVGGFTALQLADTKKNSMLFGAQSLDWLYLQSCAAACAALGRPLTWMGNNLAFRRASYEDIGGYAALGFSITEDYALLRALYTKNSSSVRFIRNGGSLVKSKPVRTFRDIYRQRLRWAIGGSSIHVFGKCLIFLGVAAHLLSFYALAAAVRTPALLVLPASVLFSDLLLLVNSCRTLRFREALKFFPYFELLFSGYSLAVALTMPFIRTVRWKGIEYDVGRPVGASP
jgi:cellulose synthase/poly-beta-1,6-N-acetylglucosamine synthase-like glycosyltransferase